MQFLLDLEPEEIVLEPIDADTIFGVPSIVARYLSAICTCTGQNRWQIAACYLGTPWVTFSYLPNNSPLFADFLLWGCFIPNYFVILRINETKD